MKIFCVGSQMWRDAPKIFSILDAKYNEQFVDIIHGGAYGADSYVELWVKEKKLVSTIYLPNYDQYSKKAAPVFRTWEMFEKERPDLVLAFWDGASKGTRFCIDEALRRKVPLEVHYPTSVEELSGK